MAFTIDGTDGLTFPDSSTQPTRAVSRSGDTMTGKLTLPKLETTSTFAEIQQTSGRAYQLLSTPSTGNNPNSWCVEDITGGYLRRLIIDASGNIRTPAQPAFYATQNADASTTSTIVLTFASESFDVASNFNTSNGRFTAPVAGVYEFTVNASRRYEDSATDWGVYLRVNGSNVVHHAKTNTAGLYDRVGGTSLHSLNANDYVDVVLWTGSGTVNLRYSFSSTYFCGRLVG